MNFPVKAFFINSEEAPQACFGAFTIELSRGNLKAFEASIMKALWGSHHALRAREVCYGARWDPLKVHPQWLSIPYATRDLRRIMLKRPDLRVNCVKLLQERTEKPFP